MERIKYNEGLTPIQIFEKIIENIESKKPYSEPDTDKFVEDLLNKIKSEFIKSYQNKNPKSLEDLCKKLYDNDYISSTGLRIYTIKNYIADLKIYLTTEIKMQDTLVLPVNTALNIVSAPVPQLQIPQNIAFIDLKTQKIETNIPTLPESVKNSLLLIQDLPLEVNNLETFAEIWQDSNYYSAKHLDILGFFETVILTTQGYPHYGRFDKTWNNLIAQFKRKYSFGPVEINYNFDHPEYENVISLKILDNFDLVGIEPIRINPKKTSETYLLKLINRNNEISEFELEVSVPDENNFNILNEYSRMKNNFGSNRNTPIEDPCIRLINEINSKYNLKITHNNAKINIPFILPEFQSLSVL